MAKLAGNKKKSPITAVKPAAVPTKVPWLTVVNLSTTEEEAPVEIRISGDIGASYWDDSSTSSEEFCNALNTVPKGKKVNLYVNSSGGSVKDGLEMYNAIAARSEDITCFITGFACSIASVIPLAASRVISPSSSVWMIHCASSCTQGNADEHLKSVDMLQACDSTIAGIYAQKTGKSVEECLADMATEMWMNGTEACTYGLADEVPTDDDDDMPEVAFASIDLSRFKNVPAKIRAQFSGAKSNRPALVPVPQQQPALAASASAQPTPTMNKKTLLAWLKTQGHDLPENSTDEVIMEAIKKINTSTPTAVVPGDVSAQLSAIMTQLDKERTTRVTREINDLAMNRIPANQIAKWVERALKDETVITDLAALPMTMPGHAPLNLSVVEPGDEFESIKKLPKAKARLVKMKNNWERLHGNAVAMDRGLPGRTSPVNVNTFSSTLVTAFLVDGAVTQLQHRFAPLVAFTRDFTVDPMKPRATGQLKFTKTPTGTSSQGTLAVTQGVGGSTTNIINPTTGLAIVNGVMTNTSTFESGDSDVEAVTIYVNQYTRSFNVSNSDLNSGLRMENLVNMNSAVFADAIMNVATFPITAATYNAFTTNYVVTSANFGFSDIQVLYGNLKKSPIKNLILDGEYFAKLFNTPSFFQKGIESDDDTGALKAFGWDAICQLTDWGAAGANIRGFACNPQAIGAISGLPVAMPTNNGTLQMTTVKIPGADITIAVYRWYALNSRTEWCSYDVMFGASALDITAGRALASA